MSSAPGGVTGDVNVVSGDAEAGASGGLVLNTGAAEGAAGSIVVSSGSSAAGAGSGVSKSGNMMIKQFQKMNLFNMKIQWFKSIMSEILAGF